MAKRVCLLTGNETNCTDSCYRCGCGGEVALNDFYVPIYNIQRVCDIVKGFECTSIEVDVIGIRNILTGDNIEVLYWMPMPEPPQD